MGPAASSLVRPGAPRGGGVGGTVFYIPPTSPTVAGSGQQYTISALTTSQGFVNWADGRFDTSASHLAIVPFGPLGGNVSGPSVKAILLPPHPRGEIVPCAAA